MSKFKQFTISAVDQCTETTKYIN